jgi:xanthine dehydrogenase accessory factor
MREVLEALLDEMRAGRPCVLATVVRASGSTPRTAGARMLVRADGSTLGTIGGGAFEATVGADAADLLKAEDPAVAVRRYAFTEQGDDALGMACGGTAEVLLELVAGGPRLVIFGCGHVGVALARLASAVGFDPVLVDDRDEACEAARRERAGRVFRCDASWSEIPEIGAASFVAVVTRCHRTDRLALRAVASSGARYVGLIGSRRKKAVIFRELAQADGVDAAWLESVRCPIGLPIGGETPEEIAVSIVAELQQERYRTR